MCISYWASPNSPFQFVCLVPDEHSPGVKSSFYCLVITLELPCNEHSILSYF
jgi:hypothetical protein